MNAWSDGILPHELAARFARCPDSSENLRAATSWLADKGFGSMIDSIILLLGPPAAQSDKDLVVKLARERQQTYEDTLIEQLPLLVDPLARSASGQPSELDMLFSAVLDHPVTLRSYSCTYIEKSDTRYPVVTFATRDIIDSDGRRAAEIVSTRLQDSAVRAALAEAVGKRLGVEWARVVVTYGSADGG